MHPEIKKFLLELETELPIQRLCFFFFAISSGIIYGGNLWFDQNIFKVFLFLTTLLFLFFSILELYKKRKIKKIKNLLKK